MPPYQALFPTRKTVAEIPASIHRPVPRNVAVPCARLNVPGAEGEMGSQHDNPFSSQEIIRVPSDDSAILRP
jgi:hypothetical protein